MSAASLRLALFACLAHVGCGYGKGDPLQMSKRIQIGDKVTAWHDVPLNNAPEFGETKAWIVPGLVDSLKARSSQIKLSFSFGHDRLVTSWLSLSPDANVIRFKFTHAEGELVDLHSQHFSDDAARETLASSWALEQPGAEIKKQDSMVHEGADDYLTLLYEWDEVSALDVNAGLNGLFLSGFLFTIFSAAAVVISLPVEW